MGCDAVNKMKKNRKAKLQQWRKKMRLLRRPYYYFYHWEPSHPIEFLNSSRIFDTEFSPTSHIFSKLLRHSEVRSGFIYIHICASLRVSVRWQMCALARIAELAMYTMQVEFLPWLLYMHIHTVHPYKSPQRCNGGSDIRINHKRYAALRTRWSFDSKREKRC